MPVAAVWAAILALRHALYDWGVLPSRRGALPTVVIGNVELGGTGKTPHVLDVAHRLEGLLGEGAVGILSRGYGRKTTGLFVGEGRRDVARFRRRTLDDAVSLAVGGRGRV